MERLLLGERWVGNHGFSNSYKIVVVGQNIIHIQYEIHKMIKQSREQKYYFDSAYESTLQEKHVI